MAIDNFAFSDQCALLSWGIAETLDLVLQQQITSDVSGLF